MRRTEQRQRSPQPLPRLLPLHLQSQSFYRTWVLPWGPNHHLQNVSLSPDVFFSTWSLKRIGHLVPFFFPGHSPRVTVIQYALASPWAFLPWASLKQASLVSALDARMGPRGLSQPIHSLLARGLLFTTPLLRELSSEPGLKKKTARGRHSTKPGI